MGAEIKWPDAFKVGVIRFGPEFERSETRDPYAGCAVIEHHVHYCVIGPLAGEMTRQDHDAILERCAEEGFPRARVERGGKLWEYDLTEKPFRRSRVENE